MILNQFCINFAKMKVLAILAIITLTIFKGEWNSRFHVKISKTVFTKFFFTVESHGLTCMTCGKETVEGKVTVISRNFWFHVIFNFTKFLISRDF